MKKVLVLSTAIALAVVLSACGNKDGKTSASATPTIAVKTVSPAATASATPTKAPATTAPATTAPAAAAAELTMIASSATFKFDKEEYKVKKGQPIKLTLVNKDGVHGIGITDLNVKLDKSTMSQTITPDKAGTYVIKCIIPCGSGHMTMTSKLIVE